TRGAPFILARFSAASYASPMNWRGKARVAARLLCATALTLAMPILAQPAPPTDPAELDPSAPLEPLPDLGVDWPETGTDIPPVPAENPETGPVETPAAPAVSESELADTGAELYYSIAIEGLEAVGPSAELIAAFNQQSALHKNRNEAVNAAQIDRRSRSDAELLAELLRSQGYYDAMVEPRIERAGNSLRVVLHAESGAQYRFQSVELPGLDAAGAEAPKLREAFAVKAGDLVIAEDVIAANVALTVALGEQGFPLPKVGEQQILIDHDAHTAQLVLPVETGPLASFGAIRVSGKPPFSARHVALIA